jgi:diacylglycerol kinase (ATP)
VTAWTAIVNPAAGGGRCGKRADRAIAALRARGLEIDAHRTTAPGDATRIAREALDRGVRRFLAIGGDGTSFEIVNGLAPFADRRAPPGGGETPVLAMLPLGTGNSFLRDFGIASAASAMSAIARRGEHPCDVLRIEHEGGVVHAINIVGLGFSAEVGALTNRRYKRLGAAGYVVAVLRTAMDLKFPTYGLRVDGGERDARPSILLSFCNSRCTAGTMKMAPHAEVADGMLDVIRIGPRSRASFVASFPSIFAGKHVERSGVEELRARRVEIETGGEIDCMIDGEILRLAPRSIEVLPSALRVVA